MRSLIVCLLSVSGCFCETKTVEVQSGETVTLLCSDFTASRVQTDWFRVVNSTEVSCISSIFSSDGDPSFCDGFDGVKFEMNSNSSSVSLKISGVDESDSGLYFCGFYRNRHTVIGDVTQLIIKVINFRISVFQTQDSSDPNSAALKFSKSRKNGRPAENRKLETCVMYSVRRQTYSSV
uniref:Ig-like domain-containing protein n=1 Tax=Oryzias latipes TaxID=8090 RepID=A0A3P9JL78_ORYLA